MLKIENAHFCIIDLRVIEFLRAIANLVEILISQDSLSVEFITFEY